MSQTDFRETFVALLDEFDFDEVKRTTDWSLGEIFGAAANAVLLAREKANEGVGEHQQDNFRAEVGQDYISLQYVPVSCKVYTKLPF